MTLFARHFLPRLQRAFTLIEMLVVMIIVSLLVTVIMQGFGYSLGLYQRVIQTQKSAYSEVLAYNWFRSSLGSQVAVRPKDKGLEGNVESISTYSYQPLLAQNGVKTRIQWELQSLNKGVELRYVEDKQSMTIFRWPNSTGQFEYLSQDNQWINYWPPKKADLPPLPRALRLVITTGDEVRSYVVKTRTRLTSIVTMDELLYGR